MKQGNQIQIKSYEFAIRVVKLYRYLIDKKKNLYFQSKYYDQEPQSEQMLKRH